MREVKRVPLDFDWPLRERWHGYVMPARLREPPCRLCLRPPSSLSALLGIAAYGDGLTPEARAIADTFYPHQIPCLDPAVQQRLAWHDKIGQAEVDNLVAHHRLDRTLWDTVELPEPWEMVDDGDGGSYPRRYTWIRNDKPAPTAAEVNAAQHTTVGHDAGNRHILVQFRCQTLGIPMECEGCQGLGTVEAYAGQRAEAKAWTRTDPPAGDGWQLWECVSEGSPVSDVFATAEDLARWLTTPDGGYALGADRPLTISQARRFVDIGWSATGYTDSGGFHHGPEYVATTRLLDDITSADTGAQIPRPRTHSEESAPGRVRSQPSGGTDSA